MVNEELRQSWLNFIENNQVHEQAIRKIILASWQRCLKLGVDPYQKEVTKVCTPDEFNQVLEENEFLIRISLPVMEKLYEFVVGSGFTVTLADRQGILLKVIGDEGIRERVKKGNFTEGAYWCESYAGTNAIGTCLAIAKPIQIFAHEHFCRCSQHSSCSSAPIYDPDGNIVGVLDMTGRDDQVHSHTLGMVVAAANAISNSMAILRAEQSCQLANRYQSTIIDSISEALLATDSQGCITHLNGLARTSLGLQIGDILYQSIYSILPEDNEELFTMIKTGKYVTDREIAISTSKGKTKFTITSRPIHTNDNTVDGMVLIINEFKRAQKIAQRMAGASAVMTFENLIGRDKAFVDSIEMAKLAATGDSNVLLLGESGTGKDVFAQAIHNLSYRKNGPFVAINCAAIPRELIGSELFGYIEGAYTGAKRGGNPGKFELADGGTIFLDEIGEMPLEHQATLLRVIEQKRIVRIGGQEVIPVDVRIIAATNQALQSRVQKGLFRQDLFYRLNVMTIKMIPLRQRVDDIPLLVNYFYQRLTKKLGKKAFPIPKEYISLLYNHQWSGNIRELQNVVERGVNLSRTGLLDVSYFPDEIRKTDQHLGQQPNSNLEEFEREMIYKLMQDHQGNISKVSDQLGIARTTLYRKLSKFGIKKEISM